MSRHSSSDTVASSAVQTAARRPDRTPSGTGSFDLTGEAGIPFVRLVRVELRKLYDTRAGLWLMISIAALTVVAMGILITVALTQDSEISLKDLVGVAATPMGVLLPVMGVLSVTSEWSQRTHMVTFTLEPRRVRVIAAKLVVGVVVAVASVVVAAVIGVVCNLLYGALGGSALSWNFGPEPFAGFVILQVIGLLTGFGLGMLLVNTPAAIVVYFAYSFVLPGLFALGASVWDWFDTLRPWLDFADAQTPLFMEGFGAVSWDHLAVSGVIWFVVPLALGVWRLVRAEVK